MGKRGRHITTPAERLAGKYAIDAESGCWLWTHSVNNKGYGTISLTTGPYQSSPAYAHRVSYEAHRGPIPDGLVLDHLCSTPRCINPDHLEPVTQLENVRRSAKVNPFDVTGACGRGHDMTDPSNVYIRPDNGRRMCKACIRLRQRKKAG